MYLKKLVFICLIIQLIACGQKGALRLNDTSPEKTKAVSVSAKSNVIQANEKKKKDLTQ